MEAHARQAELSSRPASAMVECMPFDTTPGSYRTLTFDLMILWKTFGAVLRGSGAY